MTDQPVALEQSTSWAPEIILVVAIVGWILYELYGRTALEWLSQWAMYIRLGGGIVVILYLWWQLREKPEEFQDTLGMAKQLLTHVGPQLAGGVGATTREKRNVSGLLKKKVAASQQWKCGNCQALLDETYEVDHRLALYKGGSNDESNLVALCPNCHRRKTVAERLA
jgi:hypothetical protein